MVSARDLQCSLAESAIRRRWCVNRPTCRRQRANRFGESYGFGDCHRCSFGGVGGHTSCCGSFSKPPPTDPTADGARSPASTLSLADPLAHSLAYDDSAAATPSLHFYFLPTRTNVLLHRLGGGRRRIAGSRRTGQKRAGVPRRYGPDTKLGALLRNMLQLEPTLRPTTLEALLGVADVAGLPLGDGGDGDERFRQMSTGDWIQQYRSLRAAVSQRGGVSAYR